LHQRLPLHGRCIAEARTFAKQIVIPVCDHFFDGTPENRALLEQTYSEHPDCIFIEFAYSAKKLYTRLSFDRHKMRIGSRFGIRQRATSLNFLSREGDRLSTFWMQMKSSKEALWPNGWLTAR